jgi:hypothetical protein
MHLRVLKKDAQSPPQNRLAARCRILFRSALSEARPHAAPGRYDDRGIMALILVLILHSAFYISE